MKTKQDDHRLSDKELEFELNKKLWKYLINCLVETKRVIYIYADEPLTDDLKNKVKAEITSLIPSEGFVALFKKRNRKQ